MRQKPEVEVSIRPVLVDKKTAAMMLGNISVDKLDELLKSGRIVAKTIDKRVCFAVSEVERFATDCASWEPGRAAS